MQTRELIAGRELDALVAEKVMGLENVSLRQHVQGEDLFGERDGLTEWVPSYSTDIAAAWQVVEHFGANWVTGLVRREFCGQMMWSCSIDEADEDGHVVRSRVRSEAKTAPLAICRAALNSASH